MTVGWVGRGGGVQSGGEREKGGWAQFDWMLDGGSLKAKPIGFRLVCLKKTKRWLSEK
jgi:hypothetical protein